MFRASVFIESLVLFFIILCCLFIALPFVLKSNQKEHNIAIWAQKFSKIQYAYTALKAQSEEKNSDFISNEFNDRMKFLLREKRFVVSGYKQKFLNRKNKNDIYIFDEFFENENGTVYGFKWIDRECKGQELCAVMSVDINGLKKPNVWGEDIFGVNFYRDSVEPAGQRFNLSSILQDCSKDGSGVYCSTFYLMGGSINR